jgi:hypothetical protein
MYQPARLYTPAITRHRNSVGDVLAALAIGAMVPIVAFATTWEVWV